MSGAPGDAPAALLGALADRARGRVVGMLAEEGALTVGALCARFPVSRFATMKHLNVLEAAGVVRREARGRERLVRLAPGWDGPLRAWLDGLRARSGGP